jgi:hypothetical protein
VAEHSETVHAHGINALIAIKLTHSVAAKSQDPSIYVLPVPHQPKHQLLDAPRCWREVGRQNEDSNPLLNTRGCRELEPRLS